MSAIDRHMAERLLDHARMCSRSAANAFPQGPNTSYLLAASLYVEALHCTMLGFLFQRAIVADHQELPRSLVALARLLEQADIREFTVSDIENVALFDRLHMAGVERVLLSDGVCQDIFRAGPFVERIRLELNDLIQAEAP